MPEYAKECWRQYLEHRSALRLVQCVYGQAVIEAEKRPKKRLVPRATEALVKLARSKDQQEFIALSAIADSAGFETTAGTKGLYPWLKKYGADVLDHDEGTSVYRIKAEFYFAMLSLFPETNSKASTRGILRLQGLGKEIWAGIDAQEYVDHERASWAG
ncbi:MAG: hypothetical protein IIC99_04310 [Chloroflexi bacterium]|nr:hypothetical protein [Chloroflexota bacterium]